MKLEYELIDENNITSIQHAIFQDKCAYVYYKQAIETNYKENMYYIIRYNVFLVYFSIPTNNPLHNGNLFCFLVFFNSYFISSSLILLLIG